MSPLVSATKRQPLDGWWCAARPNRPADQPMRGQCCVHAAAQVGARAGQPLPTSVRAFGIVSGQCSLASAFGADPFRVFPVPPRRLPMRLAAEMVGQLDVERAPAVSRLVDCESPPRPRITSWSTGYQTARGRARPVMTRISSGTVSVTPGESDCPPNGSPRQHGQRYSLDRETSPWLSEAIRFLFAHSDTVPTDRGRSRHGSESASGHLCMKLLTLARYLTRCPLSVRRRECLR